MPKLLHFSLDPYGRRMRLALAEYGIKADLQEERPWNPSKELASLNPSGLSPVYVEDDGMAACGAEALTEYLEETVGRDHPLIPGTPAARAEVRRLTAWFDVKFYTEVSEPILTERVVRRFAAAAGQSAPDMGRVRAALISLKPHLEYVGYLAETRAWLAGPQLSLADLAAAAHLSALDYLGIVPWDDFSAVKTWYVRMKSRPSFRQLLGDQIPGMAPVAHYADVDF